MSDRVVYCWTNLINGKQYVGSDSNSGDRISSHISCAENGCFECGGGSIFHRALQKYGVDSFSYEVLESGFSSTRELRRAEQNYIEEFDTKAPHGYNLNNADGLLAEEPKNRIRYDRWVRILDYLPPVKSEETEWGMQISIAPRPKQPMRGDSRTVVPDWVFNDKKVISILLKVFPKLSTSVSQRKKAARWAAVIYLYFRMNLSRGQIAEELNTTPIAIKFVLRNIRRVVENSRSDNGLRRQI